MIGNINREIFYYKEYFNDFRLKLDDKGKDRILQVLYLIKYLEIIPENYFKLVSGSKGLYEIRINLYNKSIRILCFFDSNDRIIILNAFTKKSRKTPLREIKLAEKLKKKYYDEKK
jgi:phage-related protein